MRRHWPSSYTETHRPLCVFFVKISSYSTLLLPKIESIAISIYVKGLPTDARTRYLQKLRYRKDTASLPDPYAIEENKWMADPCSWPELEFGQVYLYLIESPAMFNPGTMKVFKSLEAYKYVESGHVQEVKYYDVKDSPYCFLKANVLPSMRTRDRPHQAWICLNKETADVYCAHCYCLAGLGEMCSHIAALLFKVELGVRFGLTQKSVTSEGCKWNQVFRKELESITIQDLQDTCNSNRKEKIDCIIPTSFDPLPAEDIITAFKDICPNAAFFSLLPGYENCDNIVTKSKLHVDKYPRTLTSYYDEDYKAMSSDTLLNKCKEVLTSYHCSKHQMENLFDTTVKQSVSSLWYEHRKGRITGTKAHDILVRRPTTNPEKLICRIMDYKSYDLSKKCAIKWGLENEAETRQIYREIKEKTHSEFKCQEAGFKISSSNFFMGCSADGIISCRCCGRGTLEIKCPFKHKDITVQVDKDFFLNSNMNLKIHHKYYMQVQFQMMVFDYTYCDFVVMTKPSPEMSLVTIRIPRDDGFCSNLVSKCSEFHTKYVIPEILTRSIMDKSVPATNNNIDPVIGTDRDVLWCLCHEKEYGKMIRCDNDTCMIGWFHYPCVNVKRKPHGKWFCIRCKK